MEAVYITARQICQRWGGISLMTLYRIIQENETFPKPVRGGGTGGRPRWWRVKDVIDWERAQGWIEAGTE